MIQSKEICQHQYKSVTCKIFNDHQQLIIVKFVVIQVTIKWGDSVQRNQGICQHNPHWRACLQYTFGSSQCKATSVIDNAYLRTVTIKSSMLFALHPATHKTIHIWHAHKAIEVLTVHCEYKLLHISHRTTKHCVWCNAGIVACITPVHWWYGESRGGIEEAIVILHCHWLYTQSRIWVHELSGVVPPCDINSREASGSAHKTHWVCPINWYGSRLLRRQNFSWSCGERGIAKINKL